MTGNTYEDAFEQLDLFADVLARVNNDYVVDINNSELIGEAINGMLHSLDPHSSYITLKNIKIYKFLLQANIVGWVWR